MAYNRHTTGTGAIAMFFRFAPDAARPNHLWHLGSAVDFL